MPLETKTVEDIAQLVRSELDRITNLELKSELSQYLVPPCRELKKWDYSTGGEHFSVWIVARFPGHDLELAYSDFGHGGYGNHWGIVLRSDNRFGRDDAWFLRLEDAFINSGRFGGLPPGNYEIP